MGRVGAILVGIGLLCSAAQATESLRFASLEWPPYVGARLPQDGLVGQRLHQAMARLGKQAQIDYYPWRRALRLVQTDSPYVGYLPEYASPRLTKNFYCSDPLMPAPLGLAQRRDQPLIRWQRLLQLQPYRIGVVAGYVNTEDFDTLASAGLLHTDAANSDRNNLRKLAAGRIDLAVVDPLVFSYLLRHDPELRPLASQLTMSPRLLEFKQLVVCFRHTEQGRQLRDGLNQALAKLAPSPMRMPQPPKPVEQ
ncbi:transporter substrate-binding domain-containing protein [Pseudaeromonas paramecii]|uniref:ABC transporter substrate-binding protein n=1 Tax=Pseudaeromonas paramecii TaxID=2138166 RepID=A0ABP8Q094_9GAMM